MILTAVLGAFLSSCSDKGDSGTAGAGELTFSPTVEQSEEVAVKGVGNTFFEPGYAIDVSIYTRATGTTAQPFEYTYGADGIFRGNPGYRFSLDDTYIDSLIAIWPTEAIRSGGFLTDQSTLENYKQADWMIATATVNGVMPTDTPVPLNFIRQNTMLEFELVGQNKEGLDIETLLIELQIDGKPVAFDAYCGMENGHACLILEAGTRLESESSELIGTLTVTNGDNYYIILSDIKLTLEAGKRYLVTLVSQGYDMDTFVYITGWNQTESGIGIPFTPPQPIDGGSFSIETGAQLVTMSFLIRHYIPDDNFDWPSRTYVLSDTLSLTEEDAERYIPIPRTEFSGKILRNDQPVDSIAYGAGQYLQLYTTD